VPLKYAVQELYGVIPTGNRKPFAPGNQVMDGAEMV
jgi:hypothetical protein